MNRRGFFGLAFGGLVAALWPKPAAPANGLRDVINIRYRNGAITQRGVVSESYIVSWDGQKFHDPNRPWHDVSDDLVEWIDGQHHAH